MARADALGCGRDRHSETRAPRGRAAAAMRCARRDTRGRDRVRGGGGGAGGARARGGVDS